MGTTKGLIVRASGSSIIEVLVMDEKSYTKSIENGVLWHLNIATGRVLPFELEDEWKGTAADTEDGVAFLRLDDKESFYEAEIDLGQTVAGNKPAEKREPGPAIHVSGREPVSLTGARWGDILESLAAVIVVRKREMPEGSYTSHLFSSGIDKIRKKTGEEAVELILARERKDMVYESADLVYHLLVLLTEAGISFDEVMSELARRMDSEK